MVAVRMTRRHMICTASRSSILVVLLLVWLVHVGAVVGEEATTTTTTTNQEQQQYRRQQQQAKEWKTFLTFMYDHVEEHAATTLKGQPDLPAQEKFILTLWLSYMDMDPSVYRRPIQGGSDNHNHNSSTTTTTTPQHPHNWVYELYNRTMAMAPPLFFQLWDLSTPPTSDEVDLLATIDTLAWQEAHYQDPQTGNVHVDYDVLMGTLFEPFRHRGFHTSACLSTFTRVLLGPLKSITYAIPSPDNIATLAKYAPLVEVGAGTGYWSAVVNATIINNNNHHDTIPMIEAYDNDPPKPRGAYFDHVYYPVQKGACVDLFSSAAATTKNIEPRTLFMVWPNNPDHVDNAPEFRSPPLLPPVWDAACLEAYLQAGGQTVVLVAERQVNIHVMPHTYDGQPTVPDSGLCASRALQTLLISHFDLVEQQEVPNWYYAMI